MKTTISHIKADIGSLPGHSSVYEPVVQEVGKFIREHGNGILTDHFISHVGDDIQITMIHNQGVDSPEIHELAWNAFIAGTALAKKVGLYGAGQDLLKDSFSGNIKGMGPGVAEMEINARKSIMHIWVNNKAGGIIWICKHLEYWKIECSRLGLVHHVYDKRLGFSCVYFHFSHTGPHSFDVA